MRFIWLQLAPSGIKTVELKQWRQTPCRKAFMQQLKGSKAQRATEEKRKATKMDAAKRVAASSSDTTSIASEILAGGQQLTVKDLQRMLNLSRNSVYKLIDAGEIETVMIAKSYRTTPEAVQRFLQRNSNKPKQPKRLSDLRAAQGVTPGAAMRNYYHSKTRLVPKFTPESFNLRRAQ